MAKVVTLQSDFIRRNLIARLKDYGISRVSQDQYVDDLPIEELQELWRRFNGGENDILGTSKRRFRNNDKQGIAIALSSINWVEGEA
ncbi:hypothetical protein [Bacillus smithii]|uniref:hypothetical protein n=1 Tax=Bacillus smithii TaxID=1479 RepID=UPI0030C91590